jgi:hypothetical protein
VVFYTLLVVKPFSDESDALSKLDDVAASWNSSVAKLGISPLFPPQENLYVGDLWAILSAAPEPNLIGKGVRLGHIDLTAAIESEQKSRIEFERAIGLTLDAGDNSAAKSKQRLFSLAFPVISVSRNEDSGTSSVLPLVGFNSSRKSNSLDQLEIPLASTFGADSVEAVLRFYAYCDDNLTHIRCTETFARNLLSTMIDERAASASPQSDKFEIRLQLITRTYLTSSIVHKQVFNGSTVLAANAGTSSQSAESVPKEGLSRQGGNSRDLSFNEKFDRPLVFGFRSAIFIPMAK